MSFTRGMTQEEFDRLCLRDDSRSPGEATEAARLFIDELCSKWKPRLGIEDWNIALRIVRSADMPRRGVLGLCNSAEHAKWAEIHILHPHDWSGDGPNKALGFEAVLVHELLHVFISDCRVGSLSIEDEEVVVTRLTDRLMAIERGKPKPLLDYLEHVSR